MAKEQVEQWIRSTYVPGEGAGVTLNTHPPPVNDTARELLRPPTSSRGTSRGLECCHCRKRCKDMWHLKDHERSHSTGRIFPSCCGRPFVHLRSAKRHEKKCSRRKSSSALSVPGDSRSAKSTRSTSTPSTVWSFDENFRHYQPQASGISSFTDEDGGDDLEPGPSIPNSKSPVPAAVLPPDGESSGPGGRRYSGGESPSDPRLDDIAHHQLSNYPKCLPPDTELVAPPISNDDSSRGEEPPRDAQLLTLLSRLQHAIDTTHSETAQDDANHIAMSDGDDANHIAMSDGDDANRTAMSDGDDANRTAMSDGDGDWVEDTHKDILAQDDPANWLSPYLRGIPQTAIASH